VEVPAASGVMSAGCSKIQPSPSLLISTLPITSVEVTQTQVRQRSRRTGGNRSKNHECRVCGHIKDIQCFSKRQWRHRKQVPFGKCVDCVSAKCVSRGELWT
jgi:hypothetical protein